MESSDCSNYSDYSDDEVPVIIHTETHDDESSDDYADSETELVPSPAPQPKLDESSDDYSDDDMVEAPPVNKTKEPTKKKSNAKSAPKTVKKYEHIEITAKAPSQNEFINSPAYKAITWMLANIHKTPKAGGLHTDKPIRTFGEKLNKKETEEFYKLFADAYPIKQAIREVMKITNKEPKYSVAKIEEYEEKTITIKTKIVNNGSSKVQVIYYCSPDEMEKVEKFNKFVHDLSINVNKNGLVFEKMYDFLSLDIWNTKFVCEYKDTIKLTLLDFPDFGFNYTDDYDYVLPPNENHVEDYIGLFNKKTLNDPYEIFKHRLGIVSGNESCLNENAINNIMKSTLKKLNKRGSDMEKTLYVLLKKKPIVDIFMKGMNANKYIERCFAVIFKHKEFKKLIISKLYKLSFLFSPYMFKNDLMDDDYGKGEKKSTIMKSKTNNARKERIIKDFVLGIQENCKKESNYWLGFLDTPIEENYWIAVPEKETPPETNDEEEEKTEHRKSAKSSTASRKGDKKKSKK